MALSISSIHNTPSTILRYTPPDFAKFFFKNVPEHRIKLANLPTPLYKLQKQQEQQQNQPEVSVSTSTSSSSIYDTLHKHNITLFIKRDDMTAGVELAGNKVRKLEFLLAHALISKGEREKYDSVLTIGGEQSNHCRATAAACRMVGLEPYLILRTRRKIDNDDNNEEDSLGFVGNVLFDRLVGAKIYTCTPGEYGRVGSRELLRRVCDDIETTSNRKVYQIPVGGSNGIGTWGYIEGVNEVVNQLDGHRIDHVVFACGSGGTAAGIGLGFALSNIYQHKKECIPKIHAIGVCDTPEYFYNEVASIADEMGLDRDALSTAFSIDNTLEKIQEFVSFHQGKGLGYAMSTQEELDFIASFAIETGIVLDPVYSGKALYHFVKHEVLVSPELYKDSSLLFWHTVCTSLFCIYVTLLMKILLFYL